jgi:hypothetical protein
VQAEVVHTPGDHEYVYGRVPPDTVAVTDPVHTPLHKRLLAVILVVSAVGAVMIAV